MRVAARVSPPTVAASLEIGPRLAQHQAMNRPWFNRNYVIVTAIMIVVIIYGSLYPFDWRVPAHDIGPVATLVGSWAETPGRGDFLSNILLYMPLGLFGALAITDGAGAARRIGLTILLGATLSVSMELTQYYDEGRVTAATDAYSNTIGAALGAIGGCVFGGNVHWRFLDPVRAHRVPVLLLAAWAGYRLFPYVPTNDIHKFWDAIRPIVVNPTFAAYPTFRHTAIWLTVGCLIETIYGSKRSLLLFPAFVGAMLIAEILIMTIILSVAHIAGAAIALCLWPVLLMGGRRIRAALVALVLCIYVIAERLEPFQFLATAHAFGWIPFLGFMGGSIEVDMESFFEKFFLYGGLIWLLAAAGLRLRSGAIFVALILLLTSWAETHLATRSAEITDAVMALIIAAIFSLIDAAPTPDAADAGAQALAKPVR
jgi:glycopeptide antibiotics resistance protein